MANKRILDVCMSPKLYDEYALPGAVVIMIDAIRASASICTAFMNGVSEIIPFSDADKALAMKKKGYITAGERNGFTIPGFDYGNSPFNFSKENIAGKKLAFTTTNGTRAIQTAASSTIPPKQILVGSFLNITALANYIRPRSEHVIILCSGWKNGVNIEDSFFAGRLCKILSASTNFFIKEAAALSIRYADTFQSEPYESIMNLSPRLKEKSERLEADFRYCLEEDLTEIIPIFKHGRLEKQ